ncbi:hypothetical protein [Hyalangium versicolor]|uniref:hypothetical protein n=1 Tax=Hyalangium versicolor TaxID=2861190 RepID=UPI001CC9876F|nr:hypothetical protein [Hyalangium versicolor]
MKRPLLLLLCALVSACALFRRPPHPVYAPPEEAAAVTFPAEPLATGGHVSLSGNQLAAIELAMEDFLPWDAKPGKEASPREVCLSKRASYDVIAAPGPEGIVFVEIYARPGACDMGLGPVLDFEATYAIDIVQWRILAIQH